MATFNKILHALIFFSFLILFWGCSTSGEFSGYSYDPEGVTETSDKETNPHYTRVIGVNDGSIWVSNDFPGARMNDFYQVNDSLYRVTINPERDAINNSPWYAFQIWSTQPDTIDLQLTYEHGTHRYLPKLSNDGKHWQAIDSTSFSTDTTNGTATLTLNLKKKPLWVSAQERYTADKYQQWFDSLSQKPFITPDTVGFSHNNHPIVKLNISNTDTSKPRGVMIITGRLHPPEVTGALGAETFINELSSDTELARDFRNNFEILAYPFANPDGVQQGHWRYNARGVDLNRDWEHFNQPETRAIRNDLLPLKNDSLRKVYYGIDFHSTDENLFYPINREEKTFPDDFTYQWIDSLKQEFPKYPIEVEPFPPNSPITKNWIFHTFGADAVTYEISDNAPRDSMHTVTRESARIIMKQLLEEKQKH
ncbi:M14 family metallopeptidase [Fodinibius sp. Rm-B-1B1-1]|uniref:M14 family metallopeptidase n=1 Tax=Fodinibius alkaliphilus TaxID=3140241 RepID=UPI003159BA71